MRATLSARKMRGSFKEGLIYLILSCITVIFVYPTIWMILNSLRTNEALFITPWALPSELRFSNYAYVWGETRIINAFKNSLIVVFTSTALTTAFASMAAYAFSRLKFKGSFLYYPILVCLAVPIEVLVIPLTVVVWNLGLQNSYFGLILPYTASGIPLALFILSEFFSTIPNSLEEAARLDGCSTFQIFREVIIPVSMPAISAVTVFQALFLWNEFLLALLINGSTPALHTIQVSIQIFSNKYLTDYVSVFCVLSITSLPIILLYFLLQRQFIRGVTVGATKTF